MAEVGGKVIGVFASNLADMLAAEPAQQSPDEGSGDGQEDGFARPIEELNLSLRSYNSLRREGIHTVGELAAKTGEDLLAIDHTGPPSDDHTRPHLPPLRLPPTHAPPP